MKQKVKKNNASSSGNVIRTILREELKDFATKDDLKKFETRFEAKMDFKLDLKLGDLERKVDEKARQYRDDVLTSNDKLAKKLETMQEELKLGNFQTK